MKNPQKQFIFTCFSAILRSRPHSRFPLPAAYFSRDRFCRYGALPSCLFAPAARRALYSPVPPESHTHAPRKSASEFAGKNKHTLPLVSSARPAAPPAARIFPPPSSSFPPGSRNVNVLFAAFAHRNVLLNPLRRAPFDKQRKFTA